MTLDFLVRASTGNIFASQITTHYFADMSTGVFASHKRSQSTLCEAQTAAAGPCGFAWQHRRPVSIVSIVFAAATFLTKW